MLQREHYKNVIAEAASVSGRVLFIQDGSELIYNNLKWTDLGPTADSNGNGIMFHSCLAVKFHGDQPEIIGLTGQKAWIREHKEEGSDRKILVNNQKQGLKKYIRGLPSMGTTNYSLRARKGPAREIALNISWAEVDVLPPEAQKEKNPVRGCYVRAWSEEDPNLEWILFTRSQITSLEEALEIVTIYKHRWLIEEYHKCLKTGCQIEEVQLKTSDRLLTLFGMLGLLPHSFSSLSISLESILMNPQRNT